MPDDQLCNWIDALCTVINCLCSVLIRLIDPSVGNSIVSLQCVRERKRPLSRNLNAEGNGWPLSLFGSEGKSFIAVVFVDTNRTEHLSDLNRSLSFLINSAFFHFWISLSLFIFSHQEWPNSLFFSILSFSSCLSFSLWWIQPLGYFLESWPWITKECLLLVKEILIACLKNHPRKQLTWMAQLLDLTIHPFKEQPMLHPFMEQLMVRHKEQLMEQHSRHSLLIHLVFLCHNSHRHLLLVLQLW